MDENTIKLTEYSHGAGCGCKIAPQVLDRILSVGETGPGPRFEELLVGNSERDDAAVMDLGDGTAIISTTDFFMPITDDPVDFGRIAAVNAISDIYAMGGTPLLAIAILGWPVDRLPAETAGQVVEGGRRACAEAGIPLAGGHSIDSPEPIFGLAVTGRVPIQYLKKNSGATAGCLIYLTKPVGVGILATAQKRKILRPQDKNLARDSMVKLNKAGEHFARADYVKAMTDVTGFGILGHLKEMCQASGVKAQIDFPKVALLDKEALDYYIAQDCFPGGSKRNWKSYGHLIGPLTDYQRIILTDPQTSGGLLVAVEQAAQQDFEALARAQGIGDIQPIGRLVPETAQEALIEVLP